jgi:hypothetical protein
VMVYELHIYNEAYLRTLNRLGPCFIPGAKADQRGNLRRLLWPLVSRQAAAKRC